MKICMASDFFYPNTGGVEAHIWQLSQCLMEMGHKVIVLTHAYKGRVGVRFMPNGLKVYYLPFKLYFDQNIKWPLLFNSFAQVRQILIRERIDIVHGHSVFSPLAQEVIFHAKTIGINTVFTDHSLFGFPDFGSKVHSHFVRQTLLQCNHIICVSKFGSANEVLKLAIPGNKTVPISVIPNAVDTNVFTPDPSRQDPDKVTIVVTSRLVYRKGIDLLALVLPQICELDPKVQFVIAGDGPKRSLLESAIVQHNLQDKVRFLGQVPHDKVRDVLVQGNIFLNTSLVEAFCIAIVEAASCGLYVVSTNVGGLPEVLPQCLVRLTDPTTEALLNGVRSALHDFRTDKFVKPHEAHDLIKRTFIWRNVAARTAHVYEKVLQEPALTLKDRLNRYRQSRSGIFFFILTLMNYLLLLFHEWTDPQSEIDVCPNWEGDVYHQTPNIKPFEYQNL